jgi:hypothetical protein
MHDIVRDYTLSAHSAAELQQRQLQFSEALIDGTSADDSSRSGVAVREYCYTLLNFHVRAGVTSPLFTEPRIVAWLLHKDSSIVDQLIQGLALPDAAELASWLGSEAGGSDHWESAQIYSVLAKVARAATAAEKVSYYRHCIAATDEIPEGSQPGALDMAFSARLYLARYSGIDSIL